MRPRAPRRRRRRLFGSFSSSTLRERAGLWRSPHTHTHTRAHTSELLPKQTVQSARAHTRRKRTEAKKRRKKGEGASHRRRRRQLSKRRQRAVRGRAAAAAAAAPTRASGSICIPALGNWGERCWASRRPGDAPRAGRSAGARGPCSLRAGDAAGARAEARMSRGLASARSAESRGGGSRGGWGGGEGEGGWQVKPGSGVHAGSAARTPPSCSANAWRWEGEGCYGRLPFQGLLNKGYLSSRL